MSIVVDGEKQEIVLEKLKTGSYKVEVVWNKGNVVGTIKLESPSEEEIEIPSATNYEIILDWIKGVILLDSMLELDLEIIKSIM